MSKEEKQYIHPGRYKTRPEGISSADIGNSAKKLYQTMFNLARGEGICYAKVATLSKKLHKSRSQVQRLINQLIGAGLLEAEMQQYGPVIYHFPKPDAARMRRRCGENAPRVRHIIKNTKSILHTKGEEFSNISSYEEILEKLTHSAKTRESFLSLLSKTKKEVDSRTILEGIIDGLGFSNNFVKESVGCLTWNELYTDRNKLITGYRQLDRERAEAFVKTLLIFSWDRYVAYPKKMIELIKNGICPGFYPDYIKAKANVIKDLVDCSDKSDLGGSLKTLQVVLKDLTHSRNYSDSDLNTEDIFKTLN